MNEDEKKQARREADRRWREANPEAARAKSQRYRDKQTQKDRDRNAQLHREWRQANPERARELNAASAQRARERDPRAVRERDRRRTAAWRRANPERHRTNERKWREENPEKSRAKSQRWREAHPEQVAANNETYSKAKKKRRKNDPAWAHAQRERSAQWAKDNPEAIVKNYVRYRSNPHNVLRDQFTAARKRAAELGVPFDERVFMLIESAPLNCEACSILFDLAPTNVGKGRIRNPRSRSIDRIVPANGYVLGNIGFLCHRCNAIKHDATVDDLKKVIAYLSARHQ